MVYVELPEVGKQVKKGETFGVVESVKVRKDGGAFVHHAQCVACMHPCMHYAPVHVHLLHDGRARPTCRYVSRGVMGCTNVHVARTLRYEIGLSHQACAPAS